MIPELNFVLLILMIVISSFYYVKSISPAALEKEIGEVAYEKSAKYRKIASIAFYLMFLNYAIFFFFPLLTPLPSFFPWDYIYTALIASIIFIPKTSP
ncbi:MAG: hypothetical protein ACFE7R_07160, partial [Candidatus Hodarchaeota archaeon]